jgi:hypothetical protein
MRNTMSTTGQTPSARVLDSPWDILIPDEQWQVFLRGTTALRATGVPLLLGGAMALATYTRHWRSTKDVDEIIRPTDRQVAIAALRGAGFEDYYEREPYDRSWIFRGFSDGVIFDIIWELPNHRVAIDEAWFERAPAIRLHDEPFSVVPAEELIRVKLYVMQRERCDWVDVLNVLGCTCGTLDWGWLVRRMGRDLPLLHGVLAIFNWMCPHRACNIPGWLRQQFALPTIDCAETPGTETRRVALFDSRPWFAAHQPLDQPLQR